MAVKNSISIGFAWAQGVSIPLAVISDDSELRIDWSNSANGDVLLRSTQSDGITRNGTDFLISFTPEQTATLSAGRLLGDLVEHTAGGAQRPLGVRIIVPVVDLIAERVP